MSAKHAARTGVPARSPTSPAEPETENRVLRQAYLDLESALDRYRDLYDLAPVGYLTLDRNGVVLESNLTACNLFGLPRMQLYRRAVATFVPEEHRAVLRLHLRETFSSSAKRRCELQIRRAPSDEIWIALDSLRDERIGADEPLCHTAISEITDRKKTERELLETHSQLERRVQERTQDLEAANLALEAELLARKRAEHALRSSEAHIRALASEAALVEQSERKRLASDLHDGLSQLLTLARMKLEAIDRSDAAMVERSLRDTRGLLAQAQERAESLIFELSPPLLHDVGLVAASERLAEEIARDYGLEVSVAAPDEQRPADEAVRVTVFRGLRELVVNAATHAQARRVVVRIETRPAGIFVEVEDDGVGYDPAHKAGFGLSYVRERMAYLGGYLKLEERETGGTKATLCVPLSSPPGEQGAEK